MERQLYSISEAALVLGGVSRSLMYRLFERGQLRPVKVGGRTFVHVNDLREFVVRLQGEEEAQVA